MIRKLFYGKKRLKRLASSGHLEAQFLLSLDFRGKVVYDVGCSVGNFTQFFAASVGRKGFVVAFEPNPNSWLQLKERIGRDVSSNVLEVNMGVGNASGNNLLVVRNNDSGTGSIDLNIQAQIIQEGDYHEIDVPMCSLDSYVASEGRAYLPDFIKIDAEGAEYDILKGATGVLQKYHHDLFIEIHGATPALKEENIGKIVKYLIEHQSYSIYQVESGKEINLANYPIAVSGHVYCTSIS